MLRALDVSAPSSSPALTDPTISGDLSFTGVGNRILGDFNSTPEANRTLFQTINAAQSSAVGVIPGVGGTGASYKIYGSPDPDNSDYVEFYSTPGGTDIIVDSTGAGTPDLEFWLTGILGMSLTASTATINLNTNVLANFTFGGTNQRILGDWSISATSPYFQNSSGVADTIVGIIPGAAGGQAARLAVHASATVATASVGTFNANSSSISINSFHNGAGTTLPIDFQIDGSAVARFGITGNLLIGTITPSAGAEKVQINGSLSISSAVMIRSYTAFTNGAGADVGTLTNAPAAGNPTKWIPINDNGTTRFIPAW